MKPSTTDELQGKIHGVKGKIKEAAGKLTNDPNLEAEGDAEQINGKVQSKIAQVKRVFGN